jgi:hypothetical protein
MHPLGAKLDRLINQSYEQRELHPLLKRMVIGAIHAALRKVTPDKYHEKCHGAALATFMLLRTLRIRSVICGGTVSWLFGGVDAKGVPWQSRCGFWTPNPDLPTPHAWIVTEFGGLVDLTCSYFHLTLRDTLEGLKSHDVIPVIWMKTEHLTALPALQYSASARYRSVDLERCDELARLLVGQALTAFWGNRALEELLEPPTETAAAPDWQTSPDEGLVMLDSPVRIEELRRRNSWVARNSQAAPVDTAGFFTVSG